MVNLQVLKGKITIFMYKIKKHPKDPVVNDRIASYGVPEAHSSYLNLDEVYEKLIINPDSDKVLGSLIKETELPAITLAELFEMTPKTFAKYKTEKLKLPARHYELSLKLIELYKLGKEIFVSAKNFNEWLIKQSYGLGYRIPVKMLNTVTGIELVNEELLRIATGSLA